MTPCFFVLTGLIFRAKARPFIANRLILYGVLRLTAACVVLTCEDSSGPETMVVWGSRDSVWAVENKA